MKDEYLAAAMEYLIPSGDPQAERFMVRLGLTRREANFLALLCKREFVAHETVENLYFSDKVANLGLSRGDLVRRLRERIKGQPFSIRTLTREGYTLEGRAELLKEHGV